MRSDEIREKIFELEKTERDEIIREEARKAAETLKSVRDEMINTGLPAKLVDEFCRRKWGRYDENYIRIIKRK